MRYCTLSTMARSPSRGSTEIVAVTGGASDVAQLLVPRLCEDDRVSKILAIDVAQPAFTHPKVVFRRVDLTQPSADAALARELDDAGCTALCHLAFLTSRVHSSALRHELEVFGSMQVLSALEQSRVRRLVLPSLTLLYGAAPRSPALLEESAALRGCAGSRFVNDKVEIEREVDKFATRRPQTQVLVLRLAPIVGPHLNNPATRWLRARILPTVLGFDPPWQLLHEEDAVAVLLHALFTESRGTFNVAAQGLSSLSALVRHSGGSAVPLPGPLARAALKVLDAFGIASVPLPLMDYLKFGWVADDRRSRAELGFEPRYDVVEAAASLRGI